MSRVAIVGDLTNLKKEHLIYFFTSRNLSVVEIHLAQRDEANEAIVEFAQDMALDTIIHINPDQTAVTSIMCSPDDILVIDPDTMDDFCKKVCQVAILKHVTIRQLKTADFE